MSMQIHNVITILSIIGLTSTIFYALFRVSKYAFVLNILLLSTLVFYMSEGNELATILLYLVCPLMLINTGLYVFLHIRVLSMYTAHPHEPFLLTATCHRNQRPMIGGSLAVKQVCFLVGK